MQTELDFEFHLPPDREKFRVWEVATILHCTQEHVIHLIEEGQLGPVVDIKTAGATRSSFVVPRPGLVKFLQERKR